MACIDLMCARHGLYKCTGVLDMTCKDLGCACIDQGCSWHGLYRPRVSLARLA